MPGLPPIAVPDDEAELIDAVCAWDREFFARNPEVASFRRPLILNEFSPVVFPDADEVLVVALGPGLRARIPVRAGER